MSRRRREIIFKKIRDANLKYNMVENGDHVAAGLSGGKDSFTMLYFLELLKKYTPLNFQISPVYIDLGWETDITSLLDFCSSLGLSLQIEKTSIGQIVFEHRKEKNPCSLCSNLRRGALNRVAKGLSCNKVALGHHLDDAVITLLMSIIYEGRFNVFKPITYLDRMDITVIRPLIYVEESDIKLFSSSLNIVPVKNPCPVDGFTKRDELRSLLEYIESQYPGAKKKFLSSIENANPESFWI